MPTEVSEKRVTVEGKFFRSAGDAFFVRGISYGPFESGGGFGVREAAEADLDRMVSIGINVVRVYTPPPGWFLDFCEARGLRVLAGLAWESHVDFLREPGGWNQVVERCRREVSERRGHGAMMGWLVANEVESALARWLRPGRVQRALESLIDACREEDGEVLFAYANYPSTEYLNPRNADFLAFNVYLEERGAFERYLERLQVLAGDRPLVVTEFGCDEKAKGEEAHAKMLGWGVEACRRSGIGGVALFAFTDEWFRGEEVVDGWRFGITRADRSEKLAMAELRRQFAGEWGVGGGGRLVSVIVCTYNGTRTLRGCLESLRLLDYPRYEVLVVDDGSRAEVESIVREFPEVSYLRQAHAGLSVARNFGAAEAKGELLAYTDDDCVVDPGWLKWVVGVFEDEEVVAAGGPNVPPEPRNLVEACVGAAPGAPAHVLLDDGRAEHLPGCNLVVRKEVAESIGGFRERYVAAGDDVDFCWRLAEAGGVIAFVPNAMVWHHRRATLGAYWRQQRGYGRAEGLLVNDHAERFGRFGGARWKGAVYGGGGPVSGADTGARIYHGVFGAAPFQFVYTGGGYSPLDMASGFRWVAFWAGMLGLLVLLAPEWCPVPGVMLGLTVVMAGARARRARLAAKWEGGAGRWLLFVLNLVQPVVRGAARWWGCLKGGRWPSGRGARDGWRRFFRWGFWRRAGELAYWSEADVGREVLLGVLGGKLAGVARMACTTGGPYDDFDYVLAGDYGGKLGVRTVTEYHGGGKCLTRVGVFELESVWRWCLLAGSGVGLLLWEPVVAGGWCVAVFGLLVTKWLRVQRVEELVGQAGEEVGLTQSER